MMKIALAMFAAAAVLAGCTPSDQAPPPEVATPTSIPVEEGTIAEMDFESGESPTSTRYLILPNHLPRLSLGRPSPLESGARIPSSEL